MQFKIELDPSLFAQQISTLAGIAMFEWGSKVVDVAKSIAELAAMKAKGELTAEEFEQAKRLVQGAGEARPLPPAIGALAAQTPRDRNRMGCGGLLFLLIGGLLIIGYISGNNKSSTTDSATSATKSVQDAAQHRKGFDCLSAWDGSYRPVNEAVKASLRDPSSFEHIETRITPLDAKRQHFLTLQFRANNGFGGKNVGMASAIVNEDCKMASWHLIRS